MENTIFQFKQFAIIQKKAAMKVGTDSVLLGSFVETFHAKQVLDIGTGTGILAIMMAQKTNAKIDAVEIDENAFEEALYNAKQTKWGNKISIYHSSIQQFTSTAKYDLIVSNPPFYVHENHIMIPDEQRSKARHNKELSFSELCIEAENRLTDQGTFWLILPVDEAEEFMELAPKHGLYIHREIFIKPKPTKPINRIVMCLGKQKIKPYQEVFTIYDQSGKSTEEYYELTREFLLWKQR
jgi:tRNA1Val (adenine37-N6)-methyltransferase